MKTEQSICPPYAQKSEGDNNKGNKNVNKREKNETLLVVCRLLLKDFTIKLKEMASICGVSPKDVSYVMKKIEKTLSQGHIIIGLSNEENKTLKLNFDLRSRHISHEKDTLMRAVSKVIIEYPSLAGSRIADRINESPMNVSRAINDIRKRIDKGQIISGLTPSEQILLKGKLQQRTDEAALEKEQKAKARELAKSFREERKNRAASAAKKRNKPYTISAMGMADWHKTHYNPATGTLKLSPTEVPDDMPRRYPKKQIAVHLSTPNSYLIPGVPPKASGTAAGRRRIGVMTLS